VTIDVGTGDGRAVLDAAARKPATLVLGLDANASAMAESSRRAAGADLKGGRPNARFVVAAAEQPPSVLAGAAGLVTVRFPWGSLLRGVLGLDAPVADGIASLVAHGGMVEVLLAPSARDGLDRIDGLDAWVGGSDELGRSVEGAFAPHGMRLVEARPATDAEIRASGSTWAKRLLGSAGRGRGDSSAGDRDRTVVRVRLVRS